MRISYFVHTSETCSPKTIKENFINFLHIIGLPTYFWNFGFAYVLNSIFSIFINNKKFETVEMISIIHFKNTTYLRRFVCCKFVMKIQFVLEVLWLLYFISINPYESVSL